MVGVEVDLVDARTDRVRHRRQRTERRLVRCQLDRVDHAVVGLGRGGRPAGSVGGQGSDGGARASGHVASLAPLPGVRPSPNPPVIWEPPPDAWDRSRLGDFARFLDRRGIGIFADYAALLRWSLDAPDAFWQALSDWADIPWQVAPSRALGDVSMPGAAWFPGGRLNHAELALRQAAQTPEATAIVSVSQTRDRVELSWAELADRVARCRLGPGRVGRRPGDRVVAYLPNIAETTVAFLATASLGAIWSSCAPEFGVRAVTDRWSQVEPKVLARGRRLSVRRQGHRPHCTCRGDRRGVADASSTSCGCPISTRRARTDGRRCSITTADRRTSGHGVRAGAVRPSALRPLLVGDDRPPEADRARPRRHHRSNT